MIQYNKIKVLLYYIIIFIMIIIISSNSINNIFWIIIQILNNITLIEMLKKLQIKHKLK